jgi:hypothetical protein
MSPSIRSLSVLLGLVLAGCATTAPGAGGTPSPAPSTPMACATPRPDVCTMEYAPVCATRDTGIRCITAPCPSSETKTYSNACSACTDPKVSQYVKGACPAG